MILAITACLAGCSGAPAAGGAIRTDVALVRSVADDAYQRLLYAYPAAGHGVGSLVPYEPVADATTAGVNLSGRFPDANPDAAAALWPRLLQFLAGVTAGR